MTDVVHDRLDFVLDPEHEAHEPPEAGGGRRDDVRLLVSRGDEAPVHARLRGAGRRTSTPVTCSWSTRRRRCPPRSTGACPTAIPSSCTSPASCPVACGWSRCDSPTTGRLRPLPAPRRVTIDLLGAGRVDLLARFAGSRRLWIAAVDLTEPVGVESFLHAHGRPIRYRYVPRDWPIEAYQTVFAREPGSAEMPSAARPFTPELVTDLVAPRRRDRAVAPAHRGVVARRRASVRTPSGSACRAATADAVNAVRHNGGRVIAAGTTVVRALATVTDDRAVVHPGRGWTEVIVTPESPVASVDGLVTGWHEPESTHLMMLEAVRRTSRAGAGVPGRARPRVPLARVRRQPPHHPGASAAMTTQAPPELPAGRRAVLYAVRRRGEATTEQVAEQLAITVSGARQHLSALARDGLVESAELPSTTVKRGRRSLVYSATPAADAYFPKAYGELTNELLGYVADTDRVLLDELFARRREHRIQRGPRPSAGEAHARREGRRADPHPRRGRVPRELGEGRAAACSGSSSTTARSGRWPSATARPARSELDFIRAALEGADVERVQHMIAGARRCAYEVRVR